MILKVKLDDVNKLKDFTDKASRLGDVIVSHGRYVVDGKSLMGLLSLDLSMPLTVDFANADADLVKMLFGKYEVKE